MALEKTNHFKWIDGILHQLFSPHPNTPSDQEEWKPVEGDPPKAPAAPAPAAAGTLGTVKPGVLETEVQAGTPAKPAQSGEPAQQAATGAANAPAPAAAQPQVVGK